MKTELLICRLDARAVLPTRANPLDAGLDFYCLEDTSVRPGETVRVRTGIAVQLDCVNAAGMFGVPGGWTLALLAWDRSGLGSRGLKVGGGVIDWEYRGEIQIPVTNLRVGAVLNPDVDYNPASERYEILSTEAAMQKYSHTFQAGDKLCNVLVQRVELPTVREVTALNATGRGVQGFGSTGR